MLPDVQRGPVGDREDANALALVLPGVVELPQLRPLVLRVPAMVGRAKGEDALLGAALLLVAPSAAERRVETIFEIGRASCRERVSQYVSISVAAVSLKKTTSRRSYTPQFTNK